VIIVAFRRRSPSAWNAQRIVADRFARCEIDAPVLVALAAHTDAFSALGGHHVGVAGVGIAPT
jgi:hypothetical protein